jgi:hypothetical protein
LAERKMNRTREREIRERAKSCEREILGRMDITGLRIECGSKRLEEEADAVQTIALKDDNAINATPLQCHEDISTLEKATARGLTRSVAAKLCGLG